MEKYSFRIPSHYNLYTLNAEREIDIEFVLPEKVDENTGIFIFVPGFGGHIHSEVYKKMRQQLADKYNMVTLQCAYFGSSFMQNNVELMLKEPFENLKAQFSKEIQEVIDEDPSEILKFVANKYTKYEVFAKHQETLGDFVDMGFMQAMDILTSIESLKLILKENNMIIDEQKVYGFGQSHGAYLLHLVNRLAPHLFERIIDLAAWVKPVYLEKSRYTADYLGVCNYLIEHDYLAKYIIEDPNGLSLHSLYKDFQNGAQIYSALGTTDILVDLKDKQESLRKLKNVYFEKVDVSRVDGRVFKSTNHGMETDFFEVIDYTYELLPSYRNPNQLQVENIITTHNTVIQVDYSEKLPILYKWSRLNV